MCASVPFWTDSDFVQDCGFGYGEVDSVEKEATALGLTSPGHK
jgi:hypothetical protein